jgi:hypothetical protein
MLYPPLDVLPRHPLLRHPYGFEGLLAAVENLPPHARAAGHLLAFAVSDTGRAIRWEVDPEVWLQRACALAAGGLTPEQWEEAVPEQDFISFCPSG